MIKSGEGMRLRVTKTVLSFCAAAFTTLAFYGAAEATLIEYQHSFTADEEIYFDYYDPSIGTLTGVTFELYSEYDLWLEGIATAPPPNKEYFVESTHYLLVDATTVFSVTLTATCTTGANGTSCTAEDHSENVSFELDLFDILGLTTSDFEGLGTFDITLTTMTEVGGDCKKRAASCDASTMWGGTGYLTYTFEGTEVTPPPPVTMAEPGTLALFGSGLAGLGFLLRRRKRRWRG